MSAPELFSNSPANGFDNLAVNVAEVYRTFPVEHPADLGMPWETAFNRLYAAPWIPLTTRGRAWHLLRRVRLDLTWFVRFRHYWSKILGGRPLWGVEDFYFLRN